MSWIFNLPIRKEWWRRNVIPLIPVFIWFHLLVLGLFINFFSIIQTPEKSQVSVYMWFPKSATVINYSSILTYRQSFSTRLSSSFTSSYRTHTWIAVYVHYWDFLFLFHASLSRLPGKQQKSARYIMHRLPSDLRRVKNDAVPGIL